MNDPRIPGPEQAEIELAIRRLEVLHMEADCTGGPRPDLSLLVPPGQHRLAFLLALIPYDMRYRLRAGAAGTDAETYFTRFPDLACEAETRAQVVQAEHDSRREIRAFTSNRETTQEYINSRFAYRERYRELWKHLFHYADTTRLPEPGELIGSCRVQRELGRGGMGVVFECEDEGLCRRVAVKVMDPESERFRDRVARERFLREAQALAQIRHPNVVTVHDAGCIGDPACGVPYFVMDIVPGETLDRWLRSDRRVSPAQAIAVALGVAKGLAAVHAANLVHRDVTPRNIIVEGDWATHNAAAIEGSVVVLPEPVRTVLLDLGLVRSSATEPALTVSGVVLGTPDYMSPEQAQAKQADHRSDLYSLGAVMYRMTTGRVPYPGDSWGSVVAAIISGPTPPPAGRVVAGLPSALSELIESLMARRPEERPHSAVDVIAALEAIAAGRRMRLRPAGPRGVRYAAAATAVAVVAALAAILWPGCPPRLPEGDGPNKPEVVYRGYVDAEIHRDKEWLRLFQPRALPLTVSDHFRVQVDIDPPAYVYVFWVEADGEVSPLYPWNPGPSGWGSRPTKEKPVLHLTLPEGKEYKPDRKLSGITTLVVLARPDPLPESDQAIAGWFKGLPPIQRAVDDPRAVVWFDNFGPKRKDDVRGVRIVGSIDPYVRWQAELKARIGSAAAYETAVSFAQD